MSGDDLSRNKVQEALLSELITQGNDSLNQLMEGILVIDAGGRCLYANKAASEFCQSSRQVLLDNPVSASFLFNPESGIYQELIRCREKGDSLLLKRHFSFGEQGEKHLEFSISPLKKSILVIIRDITASNYAPGLSPAKDRRQQQFAEQELLRVNHVLLAVRNINKIITKIKEPEKLLKAVCHNVIKISGYDRAWIARMDTLGNVNLVVHIGIPDFGVFEEQLRQGRYSNCLKTALESGKLVYVHAGDPLCTDCLRGGHIQENRDIVVAPMVYNGHIQGVLGAGISSSIRTSRKEINLFQELADDIGFALYNLQLEKRRHEAEQKLAASEEMYRIITQNARDLITRVSFKPKLEMQYVSPSSAEILGYQPEELKYDFAHGWQYIHPEERKSLKNLFLQIPDVIEPVLVSRWIHKDGRTVWIEQRSTPIFDEDGQITAFIAVGRDISERVKAEEALKEREETLRIIFNNSPAGLTLWNAQGTSVMVNQTLIDIFGLSKQQDLLGLNLFTDPYLKQEDKERLKAGETVHTITNMDFGLIVNHGIFKTRRSGVALLERIIIPLKNPAKQIIGYVGQTQDFAQRQQLEKALADEVLRRRILVEQSKDGIVILDKDFKVYEANRTFAEMIGYSLEEVSQLSAFDWEVQLSREELFKMMNSPDKTKFHFTTRNRRRDGTIFDVEVSANIAIVAGQKLTFCVCRDISDRIRVEKANKESEEKFSKAFRSNPSITVISTIKEGRFIEVNQAFESTFGYRREEAVGKTSRELGIWVNPEERDLLVDRLKIEGHFTSPPFKLRTKAGKILICKIAVERIEIENQPCLLLLLQDITEQVKAEARILLNEARLESLLKISQYENPDIQNLLDFALEEAVHLTGSRGGFIGYYHAQEDELELVSWSGPIPDVCELRGRSYYIKMKNVEVTGEVIRQKKGLIVNNFQVHHPSQSLPSGPIQLFNFMSVPVVRGGNIEAVVTVGNKPSDYDQSDLLQLNLLMDAAWKMVDKRRGEEERRQANNKLSELYQKEKQQRLELQEEAKARGLFIDVLAHELRTPLTPILASTGMMRDVLENGPDGIQKKLAANILISAQTLAHRLEELLDVARYSRGTFKLNLQPIDLNRFVDEVLTRFKPTTDQRKQKLIFELHGNLPVMEIDPSRLEQVIVNLLSNASKFSETSGDIFFKVEADEEGVLFEVRDNGIGISVDEQLRLFQPYHRVEQDRQRFPGIGLGLAVAKQIVEAHNGKIWLTSETLKGSTFSFRIPLKKA